jgi:hypothetical protein
MASETIIRFAMQGSHRTISLQPLSVEGQLGVNLALGVAGLKFYQPSESSLSWIVSDQALALGRPRDKPRWRLCARSCPPREVAVLTPKAAPPSRSRV